MKMRNAYSVVMGKVLSTKKPKAKPSEKAKRRHAKKEALRKAAIEDYKRRTAYSGPQWSPEVQGGLPGTKRSH
jgi:hypothetical protein